jgi:hypothetical protein
MLYVPEVGRSIVGVVGMVEEPRDLLRENVAR